MTKRPRIQDDLFEVLEKEKEHKNQSIGEVLLKKFPELEEEMQQKEQREEELFEKEEDSLFEGGLLD